jgi:hypothetical protein
MCSRADTITGWPPYGETYVMSGSPIQLVDLNGDPTELATTSASLELRAIPEPSMMLLFLTGLVGLLGVGRKLT